MPLGDMYGDAEHIRKVLAQIPGEIVLVGHSYGGLVITEAAINSPNVTHLIYLAAFCLKAGESRQILRETAPQIKSALDAARVINDADQTSSINPELAIPAFYAHCPPLAAEAAIARLQPQRLITFNQPITETTWERIPSTYVVCQQDGALPPPIQDFMAERCAKAGGAIERLDTDHSPFLSMPEETADIIERVVRVAPR
jgi:pimeloyl-ACP methyl ester carboxylesterase